MVNLIFLLAGVLLIILLVSGSVDEKISKFLVAIAGILLIFGIVPVNGLMSMELVCG